MTAYYLLNEQQQQQLINYRHGNQIVVVVGTPAGAAIPEGDTNVPGVMDIVQDCAKIYLDENGNWHNIPVKEVPTWRIRAILAITDMEDQVSEAIDLLPEPNRTVALRAWNFGSTTERDSQTVAFLQQVLNLTNEEVDEIFLQAYNIEA
jgi:hypothetical protein